MAKDKSEKKEKKEKRRESEGGVKKEKKEKKSRKSTDATTELLNAVEDANPGAVAVDADGDVIVDVAASAADGADEKSIVPIPMAALVPFANPLCDEKNGKKVLKTVKKAAKQKCLKRGVKEVVKAVRKTPSSNPSVSSALPAGIVVLAADISPIDVISHIPVLCEDHNIPYVYLTSRAELGAAGSTKRPTSVVMVTPQSGGKKKEGEDGDDEEWTEAYKEFNKLALKLGQHVKV